MHSDRRHISFLDPLRGLAIALVFVLHCLGVAFGQDELKGRWAISGPIAIPRFAASPYRLHSAKHSRLVQQGRAPSETDGLQIPF
jgi:hypothetical protein